jgi:hypothetical protein
MQQKICFHARAILEFWFVERDSTTAVCISTKPAAKYGCEKCPGHFHKSKEKKSAFL